MSKELIEQLAKEHLKSTKSNGLAITYSLDELEDFAKAYQAQNEQQEAVAYLKFYSKQWFVNPEIGMDGCEGLEVCSKDEIGDDGLPAFAFYTSPPKQIPDGWKPIETAPKDGTQVIIKCSGGRVATAFYDDKPFVGEGWHVVVPFIGGFGSGTDAFIYFLEDMPTHWMPLPTPTNTEVGE